MDVVTTYDGLGKWVGSFSAWVLSLFLKGGKCGPLSTSLGLYPNLKKFEKGSTLNRAPKRFDCSSKYMSQCATDVSFLSI